jgi:apolipoprotein N-acyltransferase
MTAIIDPNGEILSVLAPFTEGFLPGTVPIHRGGLTLYTRWGDWLPWVLLVVSAGALGAGILRRIRRRTRRGAVAEIDSTRRLG